VVVVVVVVVVLLLLLLLGVGEMLIFLPCLFLLPALMVDECSDEETRAEGHEDGEYADAPSPADAGRRGDALDDEGGRPGHDEEGPGGESYAEGAPACAGEVGDYDAYGCAKGISNRLVVGKGRVGDTEGVEVVMIVGAITDCSEDRCPTARRCGRWHRWRRQERTARLP
jgi:hypothetical protein